MLLCGGPSSANGSIASAPAELTSGSTAPPEDGRVAGSRPLLSEAYENIARPMSRRLLAHWNRDARPRAVIIIGTRIAISRAMTPRTTHTSKRVPPRREVGVGDDSDVVMVHLDGGQEAVTALRTATSPHAHPIVS